MDILSALIHRAKLAFLRRRVPSLRELGTTGIVVPSDAPALLRDNQLDESYGIYERIRHIERQIASSPVEIGVIFDDKGSVLIVRVGSTVDVSFSSDEEKLAKDKIITHNHPNHGYFSEIDLFFTHRNDLLELRVVTGDKVHRLTRPVQGWRLSKLDELWSSEKRKVKHRLNQRQINAEQAAKDLRNLAELVTKNLSLFTKPENL